MGVAVNEISIRRATVEDAPVIHNLLSELERALDATLKFTCRPGDIERFGFSESPFFEALIAWRDGEPVGLVVYFREFSTWRGAPGVYVQDLYVSAETRGTGLGSKLMRAVLERALEWGARYCRLSVQAGNEGALEFYHRLGFREVRNEHVLVLDNF